MEDFVKVYDNSQQVNSYIKEKDLQKPEQTILNKYFEKIKNSVLLDVGTNCLAKATNALFSQKSDSIKFFKTLQNSLLSATTVSSLECHILNAFDFDELNSW